MLPDTFTPSVLRQLEMLQLRARKSFLGTRQGGHLSPKKGHGLEFSDHRQYELGDNPRSIDWGMYARSDKLYIKRFQEEQDLSVLIALDASASMASTMSAGKWELARDVALALAYVALMQQDSVSVAAMPLYQSPFCSGPRAIHSLGSTIAELTPTGEMNFANALQASASRVRFPGVAVVISDLLSPFDQIRRGLDTLRARNLDITVVHLVTDEDQAPLRGVDAATIVDSETGEELALSLSSSERARYDDLWQEHRSRIRHYCAESQIQRAEISPGRAFIEIMLRSLYPILIGRYG